MEFLVFVAVAALSVASGITMILQRNAMYSALFLVLNFFCLAVLYVLLGAYFLAVVQVAVYAGAIMVLMLFVIMLLNVAHPEPSDRRLGLLKPFGVIAAVVLLVELAVVAIRGVALSGVEAPLTRATESVAAVANSPVGAAGIGHTQLLSAALFSRFLLPFEVTSILLLAAILGAAVLARKRPENEAPAAAGGARIK